MTSALSRLHQRYGASNAPAVALSNPAINLMLNHRSVRSYRPDPLPEGALEAMIAAAQSAATSSNLQTWSVVAVEHPETRATCARLAGGQQHIADAPLFLLFMADLARISRVAEAVAIPHAGTDYFELFLMASIDASLAAQNAVLAAESLGLSTVYIGGMRDQPEEVARLLNLPESSAVVFGLCVGYAVEGKEGAIKPRLPQEAVLHRETYDLAGQDEAIRRYNVAMDSFYQEQGMRVNGNWSQHSAKRVAGPESLSGRDKLLQALRRMGFMKAEK